jgi:hypothetical protein
MLPRPFGGIKAAGSAARFGVMPAASARGIGSKTSYINGLLLTSPQSRGMLRGKGRAEPGFPN